ncbi:MAG: hypothetical protein K0S09_107 [Sphingobacteriaceae bacterium]|jgi:PAS domain S-box-containing protein|nr:hypothetical protein [Sphingobacteriaceae bacterium]
MEATLTPQLLGELIEKGYKYTAAQTHNLSNGTIKILLKPLREKPQLTLLPAGFDTYYRITREPLQMACGVDGTSIMVDFVPQSDDAYITDEDVLEDGYFRMDEDFFKQVLESLDDYAVFTTDKKGDVNSWNSGAEKILGWSETEIIGRNSSVFFTEADKKTNQPQKELDTALAKGRSIDERYHVRKDGSIFWGSGLVFQLTDKKGGLRGFTKIMRNYEEQKNAERHSPETHV